MTNGSEISSLLFWLVGPIGSLIGYGMGKHDNGYTFGGYVVGLALGSYAIWQAVVEQPSRQNGLVLSVSCVVLAIAAGVLWQRWKASPANKLEQGRKYWNKRRLAGWWALECAALVALLGIAVVFRSFSGP